jgi:hypothetical protein
MQCALHVYGTITSVSSVGRLSLQTLILIRAEFELTHSNALSSYYL